MSIHARIRAGEAAAFGRLFDEHADEIHRYALRSTGCRSTAEDIVSLTFCEAWRLRDRLRPGEDSVVPWLYGIAANVLRNTRRAARRHRAALARMPLRDRVPDFADGVVDRLHDSDQLAAAVALLDRLRSAEREVFVLCVWSGLDYAAAAEALRVPVGTVRSRLARARARLRKLTGRQDDLPVSAGEPAPPRGQVLNGRTVAARPHQEKNR